jgi:hypothetical protein|tara:strand:+ start:12738 stop:13064 length:327 start_codon:yes stop_codon:yes gene_type:complete
MSSFSLKKIFELDPIFYNYLRDLTNTMLEYENILVGLQDLNNNYHHKRIVFINSKCSDKGYVCINCENNEFDEILNQLELIIKLHINRMNINKMNMNEYMNEYMNKYE